MDTLKPLILSIAALIALALIVMIALFLMRKAKDKKQEDGKIKLSFGLWFVALFLSGSLIVTKTVTILSEAIDNLYKINSVVGFSEIFKTGSLYIGLSIAWLFLWYFIINQLSTLVLGKRNIITEIDVDNYVFFLVKGTLLIGFTICLLSVFENVLRAFLPTIQIPFYH